MYILCKELSNVREAKKLKVEYGIYIALGSCLGEFRCLLGVFEIQEKKNPKGRLTMAKMITLSNLSFPKESVHKSSFPGTEMRPQLYITKLTKIDLEPTGT